MATRETPYGTLTFDRDAIVRAALRGHIEGCVIFLSRCLATQAVDQGGIWRGNLQQGMLYNDDGCGNHDAIAWNEAGVVGLAYELGSGPVEQLGMTPYTVTGSVDDVRGAVRGLPEELEPAFLVVANMMPKSSYMHKEHFYTERLAGVGFWLHGDRLGGLLFENPDACGGNRLAAWGLLRNGRLLQLSCETYYHPEPGRIVVDRTRPQDLPILAIIDAVTDRALQGPTEFTPDELASLCPTPPEPKRLAYAQYTLNKVGITWPGSPELPAEEPPHPG